MPGSLLYHTKITSVRSPPSQIKVLATWADAVQTLWLTPLPRIIVAESGGKYFTVYGGGGLQVVPRGPNDTRREIFRANVDPNVPAVDVGAAGWVSATSLIQAPQNDKATTTATSTGTFEIVLLSGRTEYNKGNTQQPQFYLENQFNCGGTDVNENHRCIVRVTTGSYHNTLTSVPMLDGPSGTATGYLLVDVIQRNTETVLQKDLLVLRMGGLTRVAEGFNGHHSYLYGYMFQDEASRAGSVAIVVVSGPVDPRIQSLPQSSP